MRQMYIFQFKGIWNLANATPDTGIKLTFEKKKMLCKCAQISLRQLKTNSSICLHALFLKPVILTVNIGTIPRLIQGNIIIIHSSII